MKKYLKHQPAWVQLVLFISFTLITSVVAQAFVIPLILKAYGLNLQDLRNYSEPSVVPALKALQAVLSIIIFLVPPLLFAHISDARPLHYIGFRKPVPIMFLAIATIVMVAAFPMVAWLGEINQHLHLPKSMKSLESSLRKAETDSNVMLKHLLKMNSVKDLLAMLVTLAVIPAIVEEFFFRGVLQRLLIQIMKRPWTGIILTAVIFSAIHGQFLGFFPRAVLGVVLGALFWNSGSLWPGILAHFLNNALQVIMVYINPGLADQEPDFTASIVTGSILVVLGSIWWMSRISQTSYAEVYDTDDDFPIGRRDEYSG
ncbi:MAG: CPBP family intramembrane glutamic endopeptidase [Chitinophagaceae bacterium]